MGLFDEDGTPMLADPFDPRIDGILGFPPEMPDEARMPFRVVYSIGFANGQDSDRPWARDYKERRKHLRAISAAGWAMTWISGFFGGIVVLDISGHESFLISAAYGGAIVEFGYIGYHLYRYWKVGKQ